MVDDKTRKKPGGFDGFTLLEVIVVVVILGIAALIAIPMFAGAADMQVRAASNRIAADLDYAKGLAITYQKPYSVVFNTGSESYEIVDEDGDPVDNPVRTGVPYTINFATDSNFSQVNIATVAFNSAMTHTITFDYLGSPYAGTTTDSANALNSGRITLRADTFEIYVDVEPMTGYVTITGP